MTTLPLARIDPVSDACASGDPGSIFHAVDHLVQPVLQQTLCTVNRYNPQREQLTRLYSSDPLAYPVGGTKGKAGTSWGRQVLHQKQLFIGEGVDAIRQSFDDHATIQALGLRSVINVPVVFQGQCLGTINLLMTSAKVDAAMVQTARLAGVLALPGFLA